jgi:hypothetical protein
MQELRFVAVSEDGSYAVLAVPGRSGRFILSIDERLRAVAMGQTSRLAQYEIEVESPLRPKEIQARIRAGETAEEIADAAGIPVERVRWFEGPVLAERAYIADQAQAASVRRAGDSGGPGARLGDIVPERLTASGAAPEDGQWDSRKRGDGNWQVTLTFPSGGRLHVAEWVFDPRRRHVMPDDDNAARLSLPESELPPEPVSLPGEATVTPLAPRLGAAAGMGGGGFAGGGSGVGVRSFRPERSVIPDRSLGGERSLADRPMSPPAAHSPSASASASPSASSSAPAGGSAGVADRAGMPERSGLAHSPAATPVLPRPTYHDHTDFRDAAAEPTAYRGTPAEQASAHRAPAPEAAAPEETVPVTAPPYVFDDRAPSDGRAVSADRERAEVAPPRQVVFEEPEPGFLDEQPEPAQAAPPATAPAAPAATAAVEVPPSTPAPAAPAAAAQSGSNAAGAPPAASSAPSAQAPAAAQPTPPPTAAPASAPRRPAEPRPVAASAAASQQAASASPASASPGNAGQPKVNADAPAATRTPAVAPAEPAAASAAPEAAREAAPAAARVAEPTAPATVETPAVPAAAAAPTEPATVTPAQEPEPKPAAASAEKPDSAEEQTTRPRSAAKKNAKGRRSSVPSWDEIMLGSSRQRD